jgi:hypothetical protein
MKKELITEIIGFLYILLFAYAALIKLWDVSKFQVQIGNSPLIDDHATWIAWTIPISELIIVAMLTTQRFKLIGLYSAFSLMVMFTAYITFILKFADHIPCSCGGILEKMGWTEHLIFNVFFIILAIVGVILSTRNKFYSERSQHTSIA